MPCETIGCSHIVLNASDVKASRAFYIDTLEHPLIEEHPQMFSFKAGSVRFSVFPGGAKLDMKAEQGPNAMIVLCTTHLEEEMERLQKKGVSFAGEIKTAPGFMRFVEFVDPDNNPLCLAQYLRDPLQPPTNPARPKAPAH